MIGVPVSRYVSQTKELATKSTNDVFEINTEEGATKDFDEFKKRAALDIIGFVSNNVKVTTIDVAGKIYIDQIKDLSKLRLNVKYIYAGLRSDSVTVTIQKTSNTEIKVDEIVAAASKIAIKLDTNITNTKWVDSIKFNKERTAKFTIKNSKVYYCIQFATIKPGTISDSWIKTFNNGYPLQQTPTTLLFEDGKDQTRKVNPVGGDQTIEFWLAVDKDENDELSLFLKSSDGELIKLEKNRLGKTQWDYTRTPIKTYDIGSNKFKIVMLDIDAKPVTNGVLIRTSRLRYPDATLIIE